MRDKTKRREKRKRKIARILADPERKKKFYKRQMLRIAEWRLRNPERDKAHRIVFVAKRNGSLIQKPCKKCGSEKSEAYHEDYSKPLKVIWLCKKHHYEADVKLREKASLLQVKKQTK